MILTVERGDDGQWYIDNAWLCEIDVKAYLFCMMK